MVIAFFASVALVAFVFAFWLSYRSPHDKWRPWLRDWSLWHTGVHTEYAGPGRVWFISFLRGGGYCIWIRRGRGGDGRPLAEPGWRPNIYIRGFTLYVRTAKSRHVPYWGKPVKHVRLTRNGNGAIV